MHRMQQGVDRPHPTLWSLSGPAGVKPMLGTFGDGQFLLLRRRYGSLTPFFYGEVRPHPGGSEVTGTLTFHPFWQLVPFLWLGGALVAAGVFIRFAVPLPTSAMSVAFADVGFAMIRLGRRFLREDGPFITRYLEECAADAPAGQRAAAPR